MISVKNLTKTYRTTKHTEGLLDFVRNTFHRQYEMTTAVDNISFEIEQGELVGFLGPNGAGKTTTMKMLAGILFPTKGVLNVLDFTPFEKQRAFLKQIAFVMGQRNQLLWELPAIDTFRLNKEIYEIPDQVYTKTLNELTELLDAKKIIYQPAKTLSLGQRMKMELIASLLHRPKVLFLDEPTIGLDIVAQKTIRDFIKDYQRLYGATILLTSHYMEDVRELCKRVMIIDHGKIIYDGYLEKLIKKYATKKTIEVIVEDMPDVKVLEKLDNNIEIEFPRLFFQVKRSEISKTIEKITKNIEFVDLNIYEEKIEDIVRKIFSATSSPH
ncbi:ABC transporter [Candidatus Roizmanbacteria bacterium RIFCSPLOWO2_02_FULL_37_19]|uniref:ABC transporter n=1 Tax=Candidatus Roizmanbacteria bacterium RIFCSPHIGHO2_02_FULL_37_24 TaxID=1802037 RepID=A0A1F7GYL2_9BACT|nr:MAG: ABC transporter [Candidatus Roizmanbacteria bacterium RIFCSPHIGHO2_01_FULL_38_41]OGK23885.1 MAG: ABC transporter [Candidatus Roizmanbacteria bacterium RIFCSPHIGHO2_02_FULL_37_24]OGK32542.1 MAG: ABC transporter [Candidatus Roizmanbacteria bacterium RIFCSPHIGHO2_12_FULL_37_23]OGK44225.1 MAG: ABC transporter [Candidatus Roizmanbacteria bacterium RIFCSPLOWO2_01_FULL_37_57]OGK54522.1 MAG: ABC transporter [Candidatus Roizmanbacteria bacterium RIFCSPLOWO2_02_FULL_37_19]OGK59898.1 MAG: ABC tra